MDIQNTFQTLEAELKTALASYWETATQILDTSSIRVLKPEPAYFAMEKNFFSALFLYSYFRADISKPRRILYAAVNQCLRGMVTGCDNILDDEYKMTLATDLPLKATKFRSIIDIMVSDRVLFALLEKQYQLNELTSEEILAASNESLRTLAKSGAQEASEEQGAGTILPPQTILSNIHSLKTGILFQSPWALPDILEDNQKDNKKIKDALFDIGMGCQIFDDMVDLSLDLSMNRHNYAASLIKYGEDKDESSKLDAILEKGSEMKMMQDFLFDFPLARKTAARTGLKLLTRGVENLFAKEHQFMVETSISMISKRIGANRFLSDIEQ